MVFPTEVEPVNPTFLTSGWLDSASPITEPDNPKPYVKNTTTATITTLV